MAQLVIIKVAGTHCKWAVGASSSLSYGETVTPSRQRHSNLLVMQGFTARSTGAQAAPEPARTSGLTAVARGGGEGGGESGRGGNTGAVRVRGGGGS